jgi:hypothetical protein
MRRAHYCAVVVIALWAATVAVGQAPQQGKRTAPAKRSLDQQLLDDLDRELLEGLPTSKSRSKAESKAPTTAPQPREPAEPQNPLAKIAERMRSVENRIAEHDTSAATQEKQALIVSDLEALLEAAKKAQQRGKPQGGKGSPSGQEGTGTGDAVAAPPRDSTNRIERGTKEQPETADVKDLLRRIWGHLPEKLRDEMQASVVEQFLPKYERLIEEYYKRLAEERPAGP